MLLRTPRFWVVMGFVGLLGALGGSAHGSGSEGATKNVAATSTPAPSAPGTPSPHAEGADHSKARQGEPGPEEVEDCSSVAWSCDSSDEVSKARARCSCGDADGACARAACSQAEN